MLLNNKEPEEHEVNGFEVLAMNSTFELEPYQVNKIGAKHGALEATGIVRLAKHEVIFRCLAYVFAMPKGYERSYESGRWIGRTIQNYQSRHAEDGNGLGSIYTGHLATFTFDVGGGVHIAKARLESTLLQYVNATITKTGGTILGHEILTLEVKDKSKHILEFDFYPHTGVSINVLAKG